MSNVNVQPHTAAMRDRDTFFRHDPLIAMRRFQEEMNHTIQRIWGGNAESGGDAWNPSIEVSERDGLLFVDVELPGVRPEDVRVDITDRALAIQGERKAAYDEKLCAVYRTERRYGQFYREVPLPEGINPDQLRAQFRDGILQITVPLPEQK